MDRWGKALPSLASCLTGKVKVVTVITNEKPPAGGFFVATFTGPGGEAPVQQRARERWLRPLAVILHHPRLVNQVFDQYRRGNALSQVLLPHRGASASKNQGEAAARDGNGTSPQSLL